MPVAPEFAGSQRTLLRIGNVQRLSVMLERRRVGSTISLDHAATLGAYAIALAVSEETVLPLSYQQPPGSRVPAWGFPVALITRAMMSALLTRRFDLGSRTATSLWPGLEFAGEFQNTLADE